MEQWARIPDFDEYSVSNTGLVRRDTTNRIITINRNQFGGCYVAMVHHRRQYARAVAPLVARAFLPDPPNEAWDTPIHLNGCRDQNQVDNLAWRPLWFARLYQSQFSRNMHPNHARVVDVDTGEVYTLTEATTTFGVLISEIRLSAKNHDYQDVVDTRVWPSGKRFRYL